MSFPFIIWTLQRTGGTALTNLLMKMSEHKRTDHEPFWPPRAFGHVTQRWEMTRNAAALSSAMDEIIAERYLIKHCYEFHGKRIYEALARAAVKADYRHILLLRRDEVARLVSKALAETYEIWSRKRAQEIYADVVAGRRSLEPVSVKWLVRHYKICAVETTRVRLLMKRLGVSPYEIYYEDLFTGSREARNRELKRLLDLLDFDKDLLEKHWFDIGAIFTPGHGTHQVLTYVPNLAELKSALRRAGYPHESKQSQPPTSSTWRWLRPWR